VQGKKGINCNSGALFVTQLITGLGIQHPFGYRYLCVAGKPDDQNRRLCPPQIANYFNFDAIVGMESIADLCCVQIMSSTGRPCAIAGLPICSRREQTCGPSKFCSATGIWKRLLSTFICRSVTSALPPARWMLLPWMHKED
jgi:hypothetical protein